MVSAEFSGTYLHNIDPKGRVTIPSVYREMLGDSFTVGMNNQFAALALYPAEEWRRISERLNRIPESDARGMAYVRLVKAYSYANQTLDGQGRLLLPARLREKLGLEKSICFVGAGRMLEVWDEVRFEAFCMQSEEHFGELMGYVNDRYFSPSEGGQ